MFWGRVACVVGMECTHVGSWVQRQFVDYLHRRRRSIETAADFRVDSQQFIRQLVADVNSETIEQRLAWAYGAGKVRRPVWNGTPASMSLTP